MREGEEERRGTVLNGDAAGFRVGLAGGLRLNVGAGVWFALGGGWGMDLVHEDDDQGESQARVFLRPFLQGQVGYGF